MKYITGRNTIVLLAAVLIVGFAGCQQSYDEKHPPVILISLDTVRPDHLSCYGYFRDTTPNLNDFRREAVLFTNAFTPIAHTLPAHTSLFTSLYPREHQVMFNGWRLSKKVPLLAESLQSAGYETAAVVGAGVLRKGAGLANGFDFYDSSFDNETSMKNRRGLRTIQRKLAEEVVDLGLEWLEDNDPRLFFLFLHFYDAHSSYDLTPEPFLQKYQVDPLMISSLAEHDQMLSYAYRINEYDGSILYLDSQLGRLFARLKEIGVYDQAVIIVVSDHGEGLGQHDYYGHGLHVYEEQMRVVLMVRLPGAAHAGKTVEGMTSLLDVPASILDFAGGPQLKGGHGLSFIPMIVDGVGGREFIYYDRRWYQPKLGSNSAEWERGDRFGVRSEKWKYIWRSNGEPELFNLERDPYELSDVSASQPEVAAFLHAQLEQYRTMVGREEIKQQAVSPALAEKLKALGYIQ